MVGRNDMTFGGIFYLYDSSRDRLTHSSQKNMVLLHERMGPAYRDALVLVTSYRMSHLSQEEISGKELKGKEDTVNSVLRSAMERQGATLESFVPNGISRDLDNGARRIVYRTLCRMKTRTAEGDSPRTLGALLMTSSHLASIGFFQATPTSQPNPDLRSASEIVTESPAPSASAVPSSSLYSPQSIATTPSPILTALPIIQQLSFSTQESTRRNRTPPSPLQSALYLDRVHAAPSATSASTAAHLEGLSTLSEPNPQLLAYPSASTASDVVSTPALNISVSPSDSVAQLATPTSPPLGPSAVYHTVYHTVNHTPPTVNGRSHSQPPPAARHAGQLEGTMWPSSPLPLAENENPSFRSDVGPASESLPAPQATGAAASSALAPSTLRPATPQSAIVESPPSLAHPSAASQASIPLRLAARVNSNSQSAVSLVPLANTSPELSAPPTQAPVSTPLQQDLPTPPAGTSEFTHRGPQASSPPVLAFFTTYRDLPPAVPTSSTTTSETPPATGHNRESSAGLLPTQEDSERSPFLVPVATPLLATGRPDRPDQEFSHAAHSFANESPISSAHPPSSPHDRQGSSETPAPPRREGSRSAASTPATSGHAHRNVRKTPSSSAPRPANAYSSAQTRGTAQSRPTSTDAENREPPQVRRINGQEHGRMGEHQRQIMDNADELPKKSLLCCTSNPDVRDRRDIVIILLGSSGAGMSTFINEMPTNKRCAVNHASTLIPCTENLEVVEVDTDYTAQYRNLEARTVKLIDTLGLDSSRNDGAVTDKQTFKQIAKWLKKNDVVVGGIVFFYKITEPSFGDQARRAKNALSEMCGLNEMSRVVLATSKWSKLGEQAVGEEREKDLVAPGNGKKWGPLVHGRGVVLKRWKPVGEDGHGPASDTSARHIVDFILTRLNDQLGRGVRIEPLQIQKEMNTFPYLFWRTRVGRLF
ncbi:hypothetical protein DFP72DRAFT_535993 [Ephemerocybe angulata]|uniref:Uncharacterized protein n=1 Tax=Ephemerocybe angulata TaxID=980116 RepID=A0A8H6LZD6_9AGAR|nr:hypothetical protein DFP72DRAFT_535993 [Tulosesus angulatus]